MRSLLFTMAATLTMTLIGCGTAKQPAVSSHLRSPYRIFTLYVSNQSFAIDPVDVRVEIDGKLVVNDEFRVGTQHNFFPFELLLTAGFHRIHISSNKGDAQMVEGFEVGEHDVGVVTYSYYPETHYNPSPRQFNFSTQKGPLQIL